MDFKDFSIGLKIIIQVKFSNQKLLLIGSGNWSKKISSIVKSHNHDLEVTSIGARDFLNFSPEAIPEYIDGQLIWVATRPINQMGVLNMIIPHTNKVIIEKPFATSTQELEKMLNIFMETSNRLYISEPWKHSKVWSKKLNSITENRNFQHIIINRGGPIERTYINPVWDWIQHDLGLVGQLLSEQKENVSIDLKWVQQNKTLNINLVSPHEFRIELNVGYFSEKIAVWEINGETKIDFINSGELNDDPINTMFEHVASENFQSNINEQTWLTEKIITLLDSKSL
jgi:hypothetical protein